MQDLLEDITRLEYEKKSSFNESATLEEELSRTKAQLNSGWWAWEGTGACVEAGELV